MMRLKKLKDHLCGDLLGSSLPIGNIGWAKKRCSLTSAGKCMNLALRKNRPYMESKQQAYTMLQSHNTPSMFSGIQPRVAAAALVPFCFPHPIPKKQ
jgi:hypothetical protein